MRNRVCGSTEFIALYQGPELYSQQRGVGHSLYNLVPFLYRDADITANDTQSYTPLMIAAVEGHVDAFELLLVRGSPIDDVDENGRTVLHLAAQKNHVEVLQVIVMMTV